MEPEGNLDQLLTADSMNELNRTASLLHPLGMSRSGSYNLLGLPRSPSFDRSRSGSLNALHSSRSNASLSASRSKSGSGTAGLGGDEGDDHADDKSGRGQNGRGRVGFKPGGLGLRRADADASGASTRARRQTSELAVKHVGRQYHGLAYGLGAQMASMLGAPATIDVVESRKDGSETVKLIKLRKKQMEAFAKHVMGQDAAPVQQVPRLSTKQSHPPSSPSKPNLGATQLVPTEHRSSPQKRRPAKNVASPGNLKTSVEPVVQTESAIKPDDNTPTIAETGIEDIVTSSAPEAVPDPLFVSTQAPDLDGSQPPAQPDFKGLEDSNLSTFIATQPNLIEALEVPEGSPMHWIRTLRKSSVRGSRQPTPASLLASVAASRSRMASQQRGSTSGTLPPPSPLPLPEGDEEDTVTIHQQNRPQTVPEVPDEAELAAFTDMLSTNVLEKIRRQLASQAAHDMDLPAPAPVQYVWETDLDTPIKRIWSNEPERDVDIRPIRPEVELIKQKLAAKMRLSKRQLRSRSRSRKSGQAGRYSPGDIVLPLLPPSAMVVAPPSGPTKIGSDEVAVDREAIMHIIKYGTPIRLP
ncbi:hypothetical protein BCR44DRAFT_1439870 [Catenaria anguillulae PL171]|uniref:Uncharacterized protein n=1 Tax=Catenaria anguillulae PL171 TaxID=765915 RepID=A0A1Y2HFC3_9FUNG|nr:hypothetical protein BCR44DRAFT_1439870 [Catenaria anguillulae PL171]